MLYLYKNLSILKKLTEIEISEKIKKIPNWTYQNKAIQTSYKFNDFKNIKGKIIAHYPTLKKKVMTADHNNNKTKVRLHKKNK